MNYSCYLNTTVIHPHGQQHVTRSLLFGTNIEFKDKNKSKSLKREEGKLSKEYWAQYDFKYKDLFKEAELFIIFGTSLGKSDQWWWTNTIIQMIADDNKELIIYWYEIQSDSKLKNRFIEEYLPKDWKISDKIHESLIERIHVVNYTQSDENEKITLLTLSSESQKK